MPTLQLAIQGIRRAAALSVEALALAAPAAFLVHGSAKRKPDVSSLRQAVSVQGIGGPLELLRADATLGDGWASSELVNVLLDRYDQQGQSDDLYEALIWIDTQWAHGGTVPQSNRVVAKYCDQRIVRWHWICAQGE